jgi:hypothetical protein
MLKKQVRPLEAYSSNCLALQAHHTAGTSHHYAWLLYRAS